MIPVPFNSPRVNAADYPVWRNSNGQNTIGPADGNNDGRITLADYTHWKERYGDMVGGAGLGSGASAGGNLAVPEPQAWIIAR